MSDERPPPSRPSEADRQRARDELLDLQRSLVDLLLAPDPSRLLHRRVSTPGLDGIDPDRLTLLNQFVRNKRISKLQATMTATCSLLGDPNRWERRFAAEHRPFDARNVVNCLQFYRFLLRSWRREAPPHPLLPDVASCEIALVMLTERPPPPPPLTLRDLERNPDAVLLARRAPGARLRRSTSTVRMLVTGFAIEDAPQPPEPEHLAIARSRHSGRPGLFSLDAGAFDVVQCLRSWQAVGSPSTMAPPLLTALRGLNDSGIIDLLLEPAPVRH